MPALSFSATEILQGLLNHKKDQTIRPLQIVRHEHIAKGDKPHQLLTLTPIYKEPRLKVGDIVTLYWKQRSGYINFCIKCGMPVNKCKTFPDYISHPKLLGKVKVTEVFEIEMRYVINDTRQNMDSIIIKPLVGKKHEFSLWKEGQAWASPFGHDLIKRDGFKIAKDMFNWFRHYELSIPKRFEVDRWKWLNE